MHRKVDSLLASAEPAQRALALMAPHAGYFYSGAVAGAVYSAVEVPNRVVVVAPNHRGIGARRSIMTRGAWRIPGHSIAIDSEFADRFRAAAPEFKDDTVAHSQEHSLELQLPFLVRRNPKLTLVPICVWPQQFDQCRLIGLALAQTITDSDGETLLVASSDMNHYESAAIGNAKDRHAIDRVLALDPEGLFNTVRQRDISMCGMVPTAIVLTAALALGATRAKLIRYADSGDASGDKDSVVGYAGITIT
jgi:AmmeMemoRadiSam system protein B